MELTPQLLTDEVDFRVAFRGYDQDEVDDFLERVAEAVGQLLDQLSQAVERARSAESRLQKVQLDAATSRPVAEEAQSEVAAPVAEAAHAPVPDPEKVAAAETEAEDLNEELRRTLVIAQRTADAVVAEAKQSAERLEEEARDSAQRAISDANDRAAQLVGDAEAEAKRRREEAQGRLAAEITELERVREAIRSDVGLLERHLGEQRTRVRETVQVLRRIVEDPRSFEPAAIPPLSGVDGPGAVTADDGGEAGPTDASDQPESEVGTTVEDAAAVAEVSGADGNGQAEEAPVDESRSEGASATVPTGSGDPDAASSVELAASSNASVKTADDEAEAKAAPSAVAPAPRPTPRTPSVPPVAPRSVPEPQQLDLRASAAVTPGEPVASEPSARHDLRSLFGGDGGSASVAGSWRNDSARLDQGPHTQPVAATRVEEGPDDAFLAELRKAMTEEEPLGPRDGIDAVPFAAPQPQPRTTRFGRRR